MHSDFRFALLGDQYKGNKCWVEFSSSSRISRYINLKLTLSIVFVRHIDIHIQYFSIYTKLSKTVLFETSVLSIVACFSLALPLSLLPFTDDRHMVCLQWNVSQCVQIWIFNISNTDSCTQTIYLRYKYYSVWICLSFSFQYVNRYSLVGRVLDRLSKRNWFESAVCYIVLF